MQILKRFLLSLRKQEPSKANASKRLGSKKPKDAKLGTLAVLHATPRINTLKALKQATRILAVFTINSSLHASSYDDFYAYEHGKTTEPSSIKEEDSIESNEAPSEIPDAADRVILRVNGVAITQSEMDERLEAFLQQTDFPHPEVARGADSQTRKIIEKQAITEIVTSNAIASHAANVPDKIVANRIEHRRKTLFDGIPLEAMLEKESQSLEELEAEIKKEIVAKNLIKQHTAGLPKATEAEALKYYNDTLWRFKTPETASVSHIFIPLERGGSEASRAEKKFTLEIIRNEIIEGYTTFEEAAKEYSDCPSARHGGFLGELNRRHLTPELNEVIFKQDINTISKVTESQAGYHILRVSERHAANTQSFDEVKDTIMEELNLAAQDRVMGEYIQDLYDNATIERFDSND
ncbi:peptidylprolyl isomerase [Coraliomargarita sp. W4R53]